MFSFYRCTSPCLTGHVVLALGICGDRTEVYIKEICFSKVIGDHRGRKDPEDLDLL